MSDKPVPSSSQEGPPPSKSWRSYWVRYRGPLTLCLALAIIVTSLLVYCRPFYDRLWQSHTLLREDIATLKSLTMALNDRLNRLESAEKAAPISSNSEQIHEFEGRLTTLQQQIETLQTQSKMQEPAGQLERSQAFEKDLMRLAEAQKIIKTTLTFWRLKRKVLSDVPYAVELAAYKATTKRDEDLALLEKYADQGLQALKTLPEEPLQTFSENETPSWWGRLKRVARSLIKIEKVGASISQPPSSSQDRQAIETLLTRLDQALAQQLDTSLPLSGDAL